MNNFYGTLTLARREIHRFLKVSIQTIFSPLISTLLYVAVFGLPTQRMAVEVNGFNYLIFLAPGLIMMGMINNSFQNPSSSLMIAKYNNTISELLVLPLSAFEKVLAFAFGGVFRAMLVGVTILLAMLPFVDLPLVHPLLAFLVSFEVCLFFACMGIVAGVFAKDFDQMAVLTNFILNPLIFLGGVFYSLHHLPAWVAKLSLLNPVFYMIDALRYTFLGVADLNFALSFSVLSVLTLLSFLFSFWVFQSGYKLQN